MCQKKRKTWGDVHMSLVEKDEVWGVTRGCIKREEVKIGGWKEQWTGCYTCSVAINSTKAISKMEIIRVVVGGNPRSLG